MNETELKDIILSELAKVARGTEPGELDLDEDVREGLDIDSFDQLNFYIALHERLGVEIPEKDYGKLTTINEILQYLAAVKV